MHPNFEDNFESEVDPFSSEPAPKPKPQAARVATPKAQVINEEPKPPKAPRTNRPIKVDLKFGQNEVSLSLTKDEELGIYNADCQMSAQPSKIGEIAVGNKASLKFKIGDEADLLKNCFQLVGAVLPK